MHCESLGVSTHRGAQRRLNASREALLVGFVRLRRTLPTLHLDSRFRGNDRALLSEPLAGPIGQVEACASGTLCAILSGGERMARKYDVIIIGAGPAGIFAALELTQAAI